MPLYYDINSSAVVSYKLFLYVTAAITFTVTPVFIYVIVCKSSKLMSSYRALVLVYLPFSMITTLTIALLIPIFDNQSKLYHFYDTLFHFENFGAAFQLVFQLVIYICDMIITDLLLFMLIDRYDVVSKNITTRPNWVFPLCYIVITITNVFCIFVIIGNLILFAFDPEETLYAQYIVIKKLLMPVSAFYQLSRFAGFVTVILLNRNFGRKYASKASATHMPEVKELRLLSINIRRFGKKTRRPGTLRALQQAGCQKYVQCARLKIFKKLSGCPIPIYPPGKRQIQRTIESTTLKC
uniref:Serpentine receptor class gamma n=1 Tax=Panagrellus redivivus TaxID=6233 RepID=A0A7E4ZWU2_PANRE